MRIQQDATPCLNVPSMFPVGADANASDFPLGDGESPATVWSPCLETALVRRKRAKEPAILFNIHLS